MNHFQANIFTYFTEPHVQMQHHLFWLGDITGQPSRTYPGQINLSRYALLFQWLLFCEDKDEGYAWFYLLIKEHHDK
jgi:hypothetical protein